MGLAWEGSTAIQYHEQTFLEPGRERKLVQVHLRVTTSGSDDFSDVHPQWKRLALENFLFEPLEETPMRMKEVAK